MQRAIGNSMNNRLTLKTHSIYKRLLKFLQYIIFKLVTRSIVSSLVQDYKGCSQSVKEDVVLAQESKEQDLGGRSTGPRTIDHSSSKTG